MSNKYLDEDDVVYLTTDIKTLSDATYEPKNLKFNDTIVSTGSFSRNQGSYEVTVTLNPEESGAQYFVFDTATIISKFQSLNLTSGTYTFTTNQSSGFTITPGNIQTDAYVYDSENQRYIWENWGITLNYNSYSPGGHVYFTMTYAVPNLVSPYADYPCRATIALTGVLNSMIPDVVFQIDDALCGNYAPIAQCYSGGVYIYSRAIPSASITIPTIICESSTQIGMIGRTNTGNGCIESSIAIPIPSENTTVFYDMPGLTTSHRVSNWNFSASAANKPPCDITLTTYDGYFTVTNDGGTTTETITPTFVLPKKTTVTVT